MHVLKDQRLMTEHMKKPMRVGRSTADKVSPNRRKVKIRLAKNDGSEGLVLTLTNIFYLPNSLSNLLSLGLFNDARMNYYNKDPILYDKSTQKTFVFAKRYKIRYLLYLLNLSSAAINFFRQHKVYTRQEVNQTQSKRLPHIL